MSRVRTEIENDQELLRLAEELAADSGRSRDEVLEDAVRHGRQGGRSVIEVASAVWEQRRCDRELEAELARDRFRAWIALARAADVDALVSGNEDLTTCGLDDLDIRILRRLLDCLR